MCVDGLFRTVSRAYLYAPCEEDIYVQIAEEDKEPGDETKCGKLKMAMYGTRAAAKAWKHHFTHVLKKHGFVPGLANPCVFRHTACDIKVMVHGDDFIATADEINLKWLENAQN